jgi:aldehyde:ferredoxin oxidoreductase
MLGYAGKILNINLSDGKTNKEALSKELARQYIGGTGFATHLLYDNLKPGVDPLSPDNVLVYATGPVCGAFVPCGYKCTVAAKSPLTGFIGEATTTSFWPHRLKLAGYDCLVINGRAEEPTYLFIDDDTIEFRSAGQIWGKSPQQTEKLIREDLRDDAIKVASIGLAGEKKVLFANIQNDNAPGQAARRTGMGAVMGSKNLKAIAVRGTKSVEAANLSGLTELCEDLNNRAQGSCTEKYRLTGTCANVSSFQDLGILPTRNFQQSQFEFAEMVNGERLLEEYAVRIDACGGCPIACDHVCVVSDGAYAGTTASIDYESLWAMGANLGIKSISAVIKAVALCDEYGLDAISTGVCIGWAMEYNEKGLLDRSYTNDLDLKFGNETACIELINRIGQREGLGDLLAQGVKRASERLGKGGERFAMHIKGLEMPGYDIRGLKTAALGWAVAARGGCQDRSGAYEYDIDRAVDRFKAEKKQGKLAMQSEDFETLLDSLAMCRYIRKCFKDPYEEPARFYRLVTGIEITAGELRAAAARTNNLKKLFNIREGWTRKDDGLPPRILQDPIKDGPSKGALITEQDLDTMLDGYYEARGWDKDGLISKERLITLGLSKEAGELGRARPRSSQRPK